jgi:hypothetical protein
MSKDDKEAADKSTATVSTNAAPATQTPQPRVVQYVSTRPLSAGEPPDIVPARVKRQVGDDPNILDLIIVGPGGEDVEVLEVRRSDRQEPGTWFEGGK